MLDGSSTAIARAMSMQETPRAVLETVVGAARKIVGADRAFAARPDAGEMRVSVSTGARDPRFHQMRVARGRGLGGQVLDAGTPMRVADYAQDESITPDFVDIVAGGEDLHGVMCVPMTSADGTIAGLLYAARHQVGGLGDTAVDALAEVAGLTELALETLHRRELELEHERRRYEERLAAHLHDGLAQDLFAIGASTRRLLRQVTDREVRTELHGLERATGEARMRLRETMLKLSRLDRASFDDRLDDVLQLVSDQVACSASVVRRGPRRAMSGAIEDLVLEVTLEGLRNAAKHQDARAALVVLDTRSAEDVCVSVQSDGAPRAGADVPPTGTSCGLRMLEARVRRVGGELSLDLHDEGSCTLRLRVPDGLHSL